MTKKLEFEIRRYRASSFDSVIHVTSSLRSKRHQLALEAFAGEAFVNFPLLGFVAALDDDLVGFADFDFGRLAAGSSAAGGGSCAASRLSSIARTASFSVSTRSSRSASSGPSATAMSASGSSTASSFAASSSFEIEHEHGHFLVGRGFGAEVAVDQFERAVGQFAREERVGIAHLGQHAPQRVALRLRMGPPIFRIGPQQPRLARGEIP